MVGNLGNTNYKMYLNDNTTPHPDIELQTSVSSVKKREWYFFAFLQQSKNYLNVDMELATPLSGDDVMLETWPEINFIIHNECSEKLDSWMNKNNSLVTMKL